MRVILFYYFFASISVVMSADTAGCIYNERRGIINCRDGGLTNIPFDYFKDKSFHTLDLGVNSITDLTYLEEFWNLQARYQVETIFLDHNQIGNLPHNLFNPFPNLRHLDLSYNNLRHIPRRFCHMTALTDLNLDGNCVETISRNAFSCVRNLSVSLERCNSSKIFLINHKKTENDVNNLGRPTSSAPAYSDRTTIRRSLDDSDRHPIEEEVQKKGKGVAASISANAFNVVAFALSSAVITVFCDWLFR